ncbi:hypothetical protein SY83_10170 [Paenibacillus swuensis]|uniref:OmpR/PhoB-type domain-containing protein n=2 Tax=Paenibacillus swuensis TaxID=1178515 RepID=A0A172TP94_9BACL|nr:hypothetical protein SY83_10170 [Paenibacillus swuensis]
MNDVTAPAAEAPFAQGAVCVQTSRIVVVTPFPERLQPLIAALSASCYDVLLFHRFEASVLSDFPVDGFILDFTAPEAAEGMMKLQAMAPDANRTARTLMLVNGELNEEASRSLAAWGELNLWPSGIDEMMGQVLRRIGAGRSDGGDGREQQRKGTVTVNPATVATESVRIFKDIELDPKKMAVYLQGKRIDLTKTEYELLLLFLESEGAVLSREDVMVRLWGDQFFGGSNVVDVHVKSLRKKLGDSPSSPTYIVTVRGVGYRLAD